MTYGNYDYSQRRPALSDLYRPAHSSDLFDQRSEKPDSLYKIPGGDFKGF